MQNWHVGQEVVIVSPAGKRVPGVVQRVGHKLVHVSQGHKTSPDAFRRADGVKADAYGHHVVYSVEDLAAADRRSELVETLSDLGVIITSGHLDADQLDAILSIARGNAPQH